jgi:putative ATPase
MIILASEDIGLADSNALQVAVAASQALAYVGLPEATYHLAHAAIYLATAPKSNSVARAISAGRALVGEGPSPSVPLHLRSSGYRGASELGHGEGYEYPHDDPDGVVAQQYFPDGVDPEVLFRPADHGEEAELKMRLQEIDRRLGREGRD